MLEVGLCGKRYWKDYLTEMYVMLDDLQMTNENTMVAPGGIAVLYYEEERGVLIFRSAMHEDIEPPSKRIKRLGNGNEDFYYHCLLQEDDISKLDLFTRVERKIQSSLSGYGGYILNVSKGIIDDLYNIHKDYQIDAMKDDMLEDYDTTFLRVYKCTVSGVKVNYCVYKGCICCNSSEAYKWLLNFIHGYQYYMLCRDNSDDMGCVTSVLIHENKFYGLTDLLKIVSS